MQQSKQAQQLSLQTDLSSVSTDETLTYPGDSFHPLGTSESNLLYTFSGSLNTFRFKCECWKNPNKHDTMHIIGGHPKITSKRRKHHGMFLAGIIQGQQQKRDGY